MWKYEFEIDDQTHPKIIKDTFNIWEFVKLKHPPRLINYYNFKRVAYVVSDQCSNYMDEII